MGEHPLVVPARFIALAETFERIIEDVSREQRVWVPSPVMRYLGNVLAERLTVSFPRNLFRQIEHLHHQIPRDRLRRYDHLREIGDTIVYFTEFWNERLPILARALAQNYYDDAARLGKVLGEPRAAALERIASELDTYAPLLRATCIRVHNS